MPDIGTFVIYGTNGICRIKDRRTDKLSGTKKEYYILEPTDNPNALIFVPADNEELVNKMKKILSEKEIVSLIESIDDNDIKWIDDNKKRAEVFSDILTKSDRADLLKLIKCLYIKRKELAAENKKLWASDENLLKSAEKIINTEFALVLNIPQSEVPAFIEKTIKQ